MVGEASLKVQGVTAYPAIAASARVRVAAFAPFLEEHRIALNYASTLTDSDYSLLGSHASVTRKGVAILRSAGRAVRLTRVDALLLVHRLLLLAPIPGIDPPSRVDVYDFDDALFVGSAAEANQRYQWLKQEARRAQESVRRARLVIASNEVLAAQARQLSSNVQVVPSCVDPSVQPLRDHIDSDTLIVGWIGSHTTARYLEPVIPVLEEMNRGRIRFRLLVIGGDRRMRAPWIEHREWNLARQTADLADIDIGIMPLPDDEWARGKSGYKLLQYFSAGVPAVASPVGVNAALLRQGRGIPARTQEEWRTALEELAASAIERTERGLLARKYVEANFSYERWAPELASMLRSVSR